MPWKRVHEKVHNSTFSVLFVTFVRLDCFCIGVPWKSFGNYSLPSLG